MSGIQTPGEFLRTERSAGVRGAIILENPFLTHKLLPGFAELQGKLSGGTDSTQIISDLRDGR